MKSAIITPCGHFFHAGCLKKWLYVQETCPLCHCQLKNPTQPPGLGSEPVPQANPAAEQNTVQQEATETSGVEHQEGAGGEPVDNGQEVSKIHSLQDSPDTEGASVHSSSSEASQGEIPPEGLAEEREEAVTRDLGGCIQN